MDFEFDGDIFVWRGPSPFYFVAMPSEDSADLKAVSNRVTYGWGVIPVTVTIGKTTWTTSLFPKDELYLVPVKDKIRKAEGLSEGDTVHIRLEVEMR
jgi:hypothetical protein